MSRIIGLLLILAASFFLSAQTTLPSGNIDPELLNTYILNEVNTLRKKAKVDSITNNQHLLSAASDHAQFMQRKQKITHFQTFNGAKRSPKNRVNFYGGGFDIVGENVLLTHLNLNAAINDDKSERISTYEALAAAMVLQWKNSPPHYANMISHEYKHTYTSTAIDEDGTVYGCQVFGGSEYQDAYANENPEVNYKPERPRKCKPCAKRPPAGVITVQEDGVIVFEYVTLPKLHLKNSRMRFYNPWRDGLAADIVVKSQYPCDTFSNYNGRMGVRGIPLEPVYKKDYMGIGLFSTRVVLGRVPDYIEEDYEVNLTVINKKRTCTNTQYWVIPTSFHVDLPLNYDFYPDSSLLVQYRTDTLRKRLYFDKSEILPSDSTLFTETLQLLLSEGSKVQKIKVAGYASIEGGRELNMQLYNDRAAYLVQQLKDLGIDSSLISVSATENFLDFRRDVIGTPFKALAQLSDSLLKERLQDRNLSDSLEFLLKEHRFVSIEAYIREAYSIDYTPEMILDRLQECVASGKTDKIEKFQRIQYRLALEGSVPKEHIDSVVFPQEKKYLRALHNQAIVDFLLDSANDNSYDILYDKLTAILSLKENDKTLNTSLAILNFYKGGWHSRSPIKKKYVKPYYDTLRKSSYVDGAVKARILLNMASYTDWSYWYRTGSMNEAKYFYRKAKKEIRGARLDVDKTFEIATYYSFFGEHRFAYNLVRNKIDETENPHDLIFFLKLIHLNDIKLPRKKYLKYFQEIREYAGDDFCSFFNNPALNFQILDDEEIKEIWCVECGDK